MHSICPNSLCKSNSEFFSYEGGFFSFVDFSLYSSRLGIDLVNSLLYIEDRELRYIDLIAKWMSFIFVNRWVLYNFCSVIVDELFRKYRMVNEMLISRSRRYCSDIYRLYFIFSIAYRNRIFWYMKGRKYFSRYFRKLIYRGSKRMLWFFFFRTVSNSISRVVSPNINNLGRVKLKHYSVGILKSFIDCRLEA